MYRKKKSKALQNHRYCWIDKNSNDDDMRRDGWKNNAANEKVFSVFFWEKQREKYKKNVR